MAERQFTIDIVTPDRVVLSDTATSLVAPGVLGSFGVLSNHSPMLAELKPGELRYRRDRAEEVRLCLGSGFLQVFNNTVSVLADAAELVEEIDVDAARQAREEARTELREAQAKYDDRAIEDAERRLAHAQARISLGAG